MNTCQRCGVPIHINLTNRGGQNKKYCASCRLAVRAESKSRERIRKRAQVSSVLDKCPRPVMVKYPGVVLEDYWTREDLELYRAELPPGTVVMDV